MVGLNLTEAVELANDLGCEIPTLAEWRRAVGQIPDAQGMDFVGGVWELCSDGAERSAVGRHVPERVQVTLGDQYTTVVNWNFRSVEDDGALAEGDFLLINPRPDYVNGVAIGRPHWLLRPRDLVPVRFNLSASPVGFYVPNSAIILLGDTPNVYRVENGLARTTPVSPLETVDEYRRIQGEGLADGVRIIVGGVHYVSDGQPVSVTEVVE